MHTRKELEVHEVEKGRLSCDSNVTQVGSAWSDSTGVVKVNRHKTNRHKMRPYFTKDVSKKIRKVAILVLTSYRFCPVLGFGNSIVQPVTLLIR